jgi:hypothetical protein
LWLHNIKRAWVQELLEGNWEERNGEDDEVERKKENG